ncbi:hypothetical protein C5S29_09805 [ANME-1 cluster archaeon GoMg3.2]|nr:hypothetical protein [ANME-1 cluster archaeon GoMg3.2]
MEDVYANLKSIVEVYGMIIYDLNAAERPSSLKEIKT